MSTDTTERLEATISGRVQGVGFRQFARRQAQQLELSGWVRNERDGTVRLVAEGERPKLQKLADAVQEGPRMAAVSSVDVGWSEPEGEFSDFQVRH